jgi:hypothetical protein
MCLYYYCISHKLVLLSPLTTEQVQFMFKIESNDEKWIYGEDVRLLAGAAK